MRVRKFIAIFAVAAAVVMAGSMGVSNAQTIGANNQGRECTTVRTCNFSRRGEFRGCLSSYSCQRCRTVISRCTIGNTRGKCSRLVCDWG